MIQFIYFETYGCTANQNNTEIMAGLVKQAGLELTNNEKIADIIVINTCIVKGPTENKIKRRINDLLVLKKPIIIAGCMPNVRKNYLSGMGVYLLDTSHTVDIVNLIRDIENQQYTLEKYLNKKSEVKLNKPKIPKNKKTGITQISEGCLGSCSFCITRFAKGNLFSYPQEEIIRNISHDLEAGCKEILLTSQDCASYGLDSGKSSLPELLKKIISLKGKFKSRIGMMNPDSLIPILPEIINLYKSEKLYKFIHIPLQSGSNRILKLMKRKYSVEDFLKIINAFKKEIPDITISTDIIVGFPGEAEEDFSSSLEIIKIIKPDALNISKYWPIQGTLASSYPDIPVKTAKSRALILQKLHKKIIQEGNKKYLEKVLDILVNDYSKKTKQYSGRTENYKIVHVKSEKNILGKFIKAKITKTEAFHLIGKQYIHL